MQEAMDAARNVSPEQSISAMPVVVVYSARIGRTDHFKRGDEHFFRITYRMEQGDGFQWTDKQLIARAVRDEFLKVSNWSEAYDFLSATGSFSRLSDTVTWSEFQRWQQFASLVLEHQTLASTVQSNDWTGELAEVLKALTGIYPSTYFPFHGAPVSDQDRAWTEKHLQQHPDMRESIARGQQRAEQSRHELYSWFRQPPPSAYSIEWIPKLEQDAVTVLPKLQMGGGMIEFLLPREALRPVLVIRATNTLEAVAAAIFADYSNGVEYRACEFCNRLFPVGRQKGKRFCNEKRCKNSAHSRRVRQSERMRRAESKAKRSAKAANTKGKKPAQRKGRS
jgi:hypothetical protein